jgi:hypothetical protein
MSPVLGPRTAGGPARTGGFGRRWLRRGIEEDFRRANTVIVDELGAGGYRGALSVPWSRSPELRAARCFSTFARSPVRHCASMPISASSAPALPGSPSRANSLAAPLAVLVVESGGLELDEATQALYQGAIVGHPYFDLDVTRLRYFGGSTNHWGGLVRATA